MTTQASTDPKRVIRSPDYLTGTGIELFAPVYRACANAGISGPQVDDMEAWQVAAALGVDMDPEGDTPAIGDGSTKSLVARRAAALKARGVI